MSITNITSFFHFLLLSTSNVRMSEGTFCRVEVHILYTIYCLSKKYSKDKKILMSFSFFPSKRNLCILHGQVFVIMASKVDTANHNQKSHVVISYTANFATHENYMKRFPYETHTCIICWSYENVIMAFSYKAPHIRTTYFRNMKIT